MKKNAIICWKTEILSGKRIDAVGPDEIIGATKQ